ncbi:uncharacterized protein LOC118448362 [Vespa mandarinia]|uniref:uncharacterized protein LOC118448362 n=1 Tax=Vespa mandarinia TaxID=7446 RepID=UPI0016188B3E|nr:uncharacterized protein LOC118448362 [Vespa mandarinia]
MKVLQYIILWMSLCLMLSQGYRILGIFPHKLTSHFIMFESLMKGLAKKGHQVDVISPFPQKKSFVNYTDLTVLSKGIEYVNNVSYDTANKLPMLNAISTIGGYQLCEYLGHPKIQKLIHNPPKDPPYDVVLIEVLAAHCFAIFGHLFNVPVIGVSTANYLWLSSLLENPQNLAIFPNNLLHLNSPMNFWQRTYNFLYTVFSKIYINYFTKYQDEQIRKYIGPNLPSVRQLEKNISIILMNSYFTLDGIRPLTQAYIEVGGLHVQDDGSKLSPELQKWCDESKYGFVYFSFGSMVKIESFPRKILDILYKSFERISPVNILMKIPNPKELPPGLPKNVYTSPWIPQLKVLQHPNVKAFITHGGLMGTQEAISCGVPMIGIPIFCDQFANVANYVEKNIAIKLDHNNLSQDEMDAALNAILNNSTYREAARKIAQKFVDRPLKAIDTANYWIEYIVKYGWDALRSPAMDLNWWENDLLDVYTFLLLIIVILIYITIRLIQIFLSTILSNSNINVSRMKKMKKRKLTVNGKRIQTKRYLGRLSPLTEYSWYKKMKSLLCIIFWIYICLTLSHGYRILGIFSYHGKSHFIMFESLMKGLVKKGHQVDVISTYPLKKPFVNYTDLVVIPSEISIVNNMSYNIARKFSMIDITSNVCGNNLCEHLANPKIQELIHNPPKNPPYDVVLIEVLAAHCFAIFGHLLNVPVIGVSSSILYPWQNQYIGNPENFAIHPNTLLHFNNPMNFWQRTYNFLYTFFNKIYFDHLTKYQDEQIRKYVGPNLPSVRQLEKNISMILVNSYFTVDRIRPLTQAFVEVGGLHVQDDDSKLSPELQKWCDESKYGFVYFSFGSLIKIESFPRKILDIFYKSFERISPINILMKIPNPKELPPGLPKNVHILPWIPQLKVLQHPNVKAFITHGGLMGTQEAISCGVPMIGIPIFCDQFANVANYVEKNIAIKLDHDNLSQDEMDAALNAILNNSTYREAARKIAQKFVDRPLKAIDTANYWIEYIVKYGWDALRSPAMDLNWWENNLLDVYIFLLLIIVIIIYITIQLILMLLNMIISKTNNNFALVKKMSYERCYFSDDHDSRNLTWILRMRLIVLTFFLAFIASQCSTDGYKILGVFPINGKSHWIMMEAMMKGLAERGHQVDVITHFKSRYNNPNYREIILENTMGTAVNNLTAKEVVHFGHMNIERLTYIAGFKLCELLEQPQLQEIIKNPAKNPPYDLVITELFVAHCYLAFGRHLNLPVVGMMSSPFHDWTSHFIGVPTETAYVPNIFSGYSQQMTFWERLINTITIYYLQIQINYYTSKQTELIKKHFGMETTIKDLFNELSLVLVNSHHTVHGIRSFPQSIIEVGGLHLSNDIDPLSPEVQKWLDESKHGCIYFTFGSMVRIETFPKELMEIFYKAFEKIAPVRVLMKVAKKEELLPGLPKNVMTQSWFSQIPILKHKNTRAFITHGGLMGTTESIYCGVPMIGIPLFGDQKINIQNYVKRKIAISLGSFQEVTEEKLTNALETILNDPSYMKNVKELSKMFTDRPQSAMDTAIYWIEYVIKHGKILQSPAIHLPWWQKNLFDVYGVILLAIIITLYIIIVLLRGLKYFYRLIFQASDNRKTPSKSKKNN